MSSYYKKCASCIHYRIDDLRGADRDGYSCDANGTVFGSSYYKRFPFDYSCSRYSEDRRRKDRDIEKALKALDNRYGYRPGSSSWWYIATFVRNTLGIDTADYFITIIEFRENYLQQNLEYFNFLVEYDMYGRLLKVALEKDPQKELIAQELLTNYIIPITNLYKEKKYNEAFLIYSDMFYTLKELYKITNVTSYDFVNPPKLEIENMSLNRKKEEN